MQQSVKKYLFVCLFIMVSFMGLTSAASKKIVIAHRGASGYLPEHSMESKAMAYAMGVDYIEQDLVMTKDDQLVVLHDHFLDRVTNVASVYPQRKREDGRYYVIDFTLSEINALQMTEGFELKEGQASANFPQRFPIWKSSFKVHTFAQEIEMIQGLNKSTGHHVGIYPEIKSPWFHQHEGKDISRATLLMLKKYGYTSKKDAVYLQCFDPNEVRRIKTTLQIELGMNVKLVQLIAATQWQETMVYENGIAKPYNYDWMFVPGAMKKIAQYADGIGPWKPMLVREGSTKDKLIVTHISKEAQKEGLEVHPYTFRSDEGRIPSYADDFEDLLRIFYCKVGVDGVFTDFPDKAVSFIRNNSCQ